MPTDSPSAPTQTTPSPESTKTPKPPKSDAPSGLALPNLIITKFVANEDPIDVSKAADGRVTIKNEGTEAADAFDLGISFGPHDGLGGGDFGPTPVEGLAAGDSIQVTINLSVSEPGDYVFTAEADANDDIAESNEDDNTKTLAAAAVALPNLRFAEVDGFYITEAEPIGYAYHMNITNAGPGDVNVLFTVSFSYYYGDSGSDTLAPYFCCEYDEPPVIAAGATYLAEEDGFTLPSGTVIVYAHLDALNAIDETSEEDNDARYDVQVP